MNRLVSAMRNYTYNEKGALTLRNTGSALLDFYSNAGALRHADEKDVIQLFGDAYQEDPKLARKALFYTRDVRGGLGERRVFRVLLRWLAATDPDAIESNLYLVDHFGRWDDLFTLLDTTHRGFVLQLIRETLDADMISAQENGPVSLLVKWLPSENASSKATRQLARQIIWGLNYTERNYRQVLSYLRGYIDVVERKMSANEWNQIEYQSVPSKAHMIYRNAFQRHDPDGYAAYLSAVERGEKKIQSGTLFVYEIVGRYLQNHRTAVSPDRTLEAQWNALPNFMDGSNLLVVADTSGSMFTYDTPMPVSLAMSLAIYAAERNTGPFQNAWINFSDRPTMQYLQGDSLAARLSNIDWSNWAGTTNYQAVFDLILETAQRNNLSDDELPRMLVTISDMQFDSAGGPRTNFQAIQDKYASYGYTMPVMVFWNVRATKDTPVAMDETGTILASGASQSVFKHLMSADLDNLLELTPYNEMLRVLNSERYSVVA